MKEGRFFNFSKHVDLVIRRCVLNRPFIHFSIFHLRPKYVLIVCNFSINFYEFNVFELCVLRNLDTHLILTFFSAYINDLIYKKSTNLNEFDNLKKNINAFFKCIKENFRQGGFEHFHQKIATTLVLNHIL